MATLKDLSRQDELFTGGHRLCAGCGIPPIVRLILRAANGPVVATTATGCLEVGTTIYPYTAWRIPWIHSAFENAGATISGIEAAYKAIKRRGKLPGGDKDIKFVAFGGDGGTYDIGLQALSGALERGQNFLYVCYDNGAYMNTGVQRSSATPSFSSTTTSPAGEVIPGKLQMRKDLTRIVVAHNVPYAAQASPHNWADLSRKAEKALSMQGPTFMNVMSPCPLGWYTKPEDSMKLAKLSVDTCSWPLYEVENGVLKITYKPKEKKPIADWLKPQGRFKHLFKPENAHLLEEYQKMIDSEWERLLALEGKRL
ncbi:MAG TPA: pyruvate ferredoxin oxidoreductase [Deltaproteobacteria bacterium]|nr:MAG: pyruvate ferredoxin oxidoreductase [Deltaproteobacteria bacterium GWA2_55_82]OGQ65000.1 MAG: pyruvate ferredoxin oxidoreductase [Deltaproteobacteria bacterium RIFCSPLOWO2_02_FULL_55_12]OIJ73815.1 MAG: pyruvate ferredoxin oxidoreductase [Deltaproteobacteria bacterium GWC2_55_46]HBG45779.1 pyruvate ferredoxin oxidoreductase [Deltaproteobacteria bacterium]HCY09802.1 pyruvate ferredoxin oxidoreductase [Deltaproteobacteria bacterium]